MTQAPQLTLTARLAETAQDIRAAQRLRYEVFVEELGGDGPLVDHEARLEIDSYDSHCDHLLVEEGERVIAVYRLLRSDQAEAAGGFYCESEYDLGALTRSGRRLLELGRSCLAADHRGGGAMHVMWRALGAYVEQHSCEILFGVASFHGLDLDKLAQPLSLLDRDHRAPDPLCPRSRDHQAMNLLPADQIDRKAAMVAMPALIKAYLRLGGKIGDGAYLDRAFNTTDVLLVLDTAHLTAGAARYRG